MLQNKAGLWKSDDAWNFKTKDDLIYIENISNAKFLGITDYVGITDYGKVIQEDIAEQLWKKGAPDADGFFTLEDSNVPKVLTAISSSGFEIKGNITLKWILT